MELIIIQNIQKIDKKLMLVKIKTDGMNLRKVIIQLIVHRHRNRSNVKY